MKLIVLDLSQQGEHERSPTPAKRKLKIRKGRFVRLILVFAGCFAAGTIVLIFLGSWPTAEVLFSRAFDLVTEALAESVVD